MLSELRAHERRVYSQGGEDGVLEHVFECVGARNRHFVEFGAWDGQHLSNTAHLRIEHGWTGVLLEGDPERLNDLVQHEVVTIDNIHTLFAKYDVPRDVDLLSIDIDGNEYWMWQALTGYRPRVVVIEYNVFFGIRVSKSMAYDAAHQWDKSKFHGASLAALCKLGREKGYSLVHTDSYAPNAVFVLDSELPADWVDPPIERVASWQWYDEFAEPEIPHDRDRVWVSI